MELIRPGTKIDFVGTRNIGLALSAVFMLITALSLFLRGGLNYGVEFTGGTVVHLRFHQPQTINDIRATIAPIGMEHAEIQDFRDSFAAVGNNKPEFLIRLPLASDPNVDVSQQVKDALAAKFSAGSFDVLRVEAIGPRVGSALRQQAVLAVFFSTLLMAAYVWFRFELRFGLGAAAALLHDVIVTIGFISIFNYEIDLTVVAALLTIVGFSVNDTVIISDRIRENLRKHRRESIGNIINLSVNETLSRTVINSGTALLVILALFLLGGNVIRGFAFALLVGFTVGTYSSIYISSPVVLWFEGTRFARARAR